MVSIYIFCINPTVGCRCHTAHYGFYSCSFNVMYNAQCTVYTWINCTEDFISQYLWPRTDDTTHDQTQIHKKTTNKYRQLKRSTKMEHIHMCCSCSFLQSNIARHHMYLWVVSVNTDWNYNKKKNSITSDFKLIGCCCGDDCDWFSCSSSIW